MQMHLRHHISDTRTKADIYLHFYTLPLPTRASVCSLSRDIGTWSKSGPNENGLLSFTSIPVENFEDHSAPPSPEEKDTGFFMLRKDSERRATLHHILTEDRDKVVANLREAFMQVRYDARSLTTCSHTSAELCPAVCLPPAIRALKR